MNKQTLRLIFDGIILSLILILANLRALMFFTLYPEISMFWGSAWIEISFWVLASLAVLYILIRDNRVVQYLLAWRRNWLLGLFVFLALISAFWSIGPVVTSFRALELLFATLTASYIGIRYNSNQLLNILFWFGALLIILSIGLVFGAPETGTMYWPPFNGAWRGIYWHRNHLGSIAALLSVVFLCRTIFAIEKSKIIGFLDGFFYILSLIALYFAESVTGYILFIFLHFLVFCVWVWLKVRHRLRPQHYYLIFGAFSAGLILILSNLDIVFAIFNRSPTLTGRVDLWNYLLEEVIPQRFWWGHGFGAIWTFDSFREATRAQVGWGSQVLIADNGFLDILLHLGVIGFLIFLSILVIGSVRTFRYARSHKTLTDFFPLLIMFFTLVANIPFSLFAETEVFVWLLIVAALFMTTPSLHQLGDLDRKRN